MYLHLKIMSVTPHDTLPSKAIPLLLMVCSCTRKNATPDPLRPENAHRLLARVPGPAVPPPSAARVPCPATPPPSASRLKQYFVAPPLTPIPPAHEVLNSL